MSMDDATNQVADEGAATSDDVDTNAAVGVEENGDEGQQFDEEGNPIEDQAGAGEDDDPEEELDLDDELKLKLPASKAAKIREGFLRQSDYTRKTQEIAEERKAVIAEREAVQAERQRVAEASEQELNARANLRLIDSRLAEYAKIDWNAWHDSDPLEAQKAFSQYQLTKDARARAQEYVSGLHQERTQAEKARSEAERQEAAARLQESAAVLARDIKGWGPDLAAKLMDFGQKEFGLSREELDEVDDPRLVKVLHAAFQWNEHQSQQKKARANVTAQAVRPAATVAKASAPPKGVDDRLSAEEWVRRRNEEVRRKREAAR